MIPREAAERRGFDISGIPVSGRDALIGQLRFLLPGVITEDGYVDFVALQNEVRGGGGSTLLSAARDTSFGLRVRDSLTT